MAFEESNSRCELMTFFVSLQRRESCESYKKWGDFTPFFMAKSQWVTGVKSPLINASYFTLTYNW